MPTRGTTFPERRVNISSDLPCARAESLTLVNCELVRRHGPGAVMLWYCAELRRESACAVRRYLFPSWPRGWNRSATTKLSSPVITFNLCPAVYFEQYINVIWSVLSAPSWTNLFVEIFVARYLFSEMIFTRWIHTYKFIIISIGGPPGLKSVIRPAISYQVWRSAASSSKSVLVLRTTA